MSGSRCSGRVGDARLTARRGLRRWCSALAALTVLGAAGGTLGWAAAPARAADTAFAVDTLEDGADASPGDGACRTAAATCTLRAALAEVSAASAAAATSTTTAGSAAPAGPPGPVTITVPAGTITLAVGPMLLSAHEPVTVIGAGRDVTVIDAGGVEGAFEVGGGALTLSGLTIRGGLRPVGGGAAVSARDSDLTLRRVTVTGASAEGDGGALLVGNGSLVLDDTEFSGNAAQSGGAVLALGSAVTITASRFHDNGAAGDGGAMALLAPSALTVRDTTFADNTASRRGGAVFLNGFRGTPNPAPVISATFEGNAAVGAGGALFVVTTRNGPEAVGLALTGSRFSGNQAALGGAVANDSGRLVVDDATFTANRSTTGAGGGLASGGDLAVKGSTFGGNEAATTGGAIASTGRITVESSIFRQNRSDQPGAALALTGQSEPAVRTSTFEDNAAGSGAAALWRVGDGLIDQGNTFTRNQPAGSDVVVVAGAPRATGSGDGEAGDRAAGFLVPIVAGGAIVVLAAWFLRRRRQGRIERGARWLRRTRGAADSHERAGGDGHDGPDERRDDGDHDSDGGPGGRPPSEVTVQ